MSSRFNSATRPRMTNPVCIKTTVTSSPTEVDGGPAALIVAAWWFDRFRSPPVHVATVLAIPYDLPTKSWSTLIPSGIYVLRVIVTKLAAADHYDVLLELYSNGVLIDDDSWHDVYIDPDTPLRSLKFEHHWTPAMDYNGVHILS